MNKPEAVVIGSGFAGLSVATNLAREGFKVSIFEKNDTPGGRARKFSASGFSFDMGPSWYWMPDIFEHYFSLFGKKVADYYEPVRLDPSYRVYFGQGMPVDVPADLDQIHSLFEKFEPGSSARLKKFLAEAEYKYRVGMGDLVYKPGLSVSEFFDKRVISGAVRLQLFSSISAHVRKYFSNPKLIQLLEFPVLFLGAMPSKTPALYSLMNYADLVLGTWYPKGGMYEIVKAMTSLAEEMGVRIFYNSPVDEIKTENGGAKGVYAGDRFYPADVVVSSADYHHTEQNLLAADVRNYSARYWEKRNMAPSSIIFYLGINKKIEGIRHHNLFFDADFDGHARCIYENPGWPQKPLFYVSATSVTDPNTAPAGCENFFVLIPTAPGLVEDEKIKERYYRHVISRMETAWKQSVGEHVIFKRDFACSDFESAYNSFKGNAYGLANTLNQTAIFKPSLKNKKVKNLFYTGQLTVPGPGVPPSLISGIVVAEQVRKAFNPVAL